MVSYRVAPALPAKKAGGKAGGGRGRKGRVSPPPHRPPPPPPAAFMQLQRQVVEQQELLQMRAAEQEKADADLGDCGKQIVALEDDVSELRSKKGLLEGRIDQLQEHMAKLTEDLTERTASLKLASEENISLRHRLAQAEALIEATPGLQPVTSHANDVINRALRPAASAWVSEEDPEEAAAVMAARAAAIASSAASTAAGAPSWSASAWLGGTKVLEIIAGALLGPMADVPAALKPEELAFLRNFKGEYGKAALLSLLAHDQQMIYALTDEIHGHVKRLDERLASGAHEVRGKFAEALEPAIAEPLPPPPGSKDLASPRGGAAIPLDVEALLGPPNPRVIDAMLHEHCLSEDSAVPFTETTYELRTASKIEWWFVVDPIFGLRGQFDARGVLGDQCIATLAPSGYPGEGLRVAAQRVRSPRALGIVLGDMNKLGISRRLRAAGCEPLVDAEVIAARLYTGPMHVKYDLVLRALRTPRGSWLQHEFATLCGRNTYATTIQAVNSAITKLAKIGTSQTLYRAVPAACVPAHVWQGAFGAPAAPARPAPVPGDDYLLATDYSPASPTEVAASAMHTAHGASSSQREVVTSIDYGFLSTTADAELALSHVAVDAAGGFEQQPLGRRKMVFELKTNPSTRGADLAWLSQYPREAEAVFPPLTITEVTGSRVDGSCVVIEHAVSGVGGSQPNTLQQTVAHAKRAHLASIEHVLEDMRFCEVPERATGKLRALVNTHRKHEESEYNNPEKLGTRTAAVVSEQRSALSSLSHPSTWEEVGGDAAEKARKMQKAAAYCRRVGRGDVASALNRLAMSLAAGKGGYRPWKPGGSLPAGPDLKALS